MDHPDLIEALKLHPDQIESIKTELDAVDYLLRRCERDYERNLADYTKKTENLRYWEDMLKYVEENAVTKVASVKLKREGARLKAAAAEARRQEYRDYMQRRASLEQLLTDLGVPCPPR